jgi:hypothetical protein
MKKGIFAVATMATILGACSSNNSHVSTFPEKVNFDICRTLPGDVVKGYEFAFKVTDSEGVLYSGRQMGLLPEFGGQPVEFNIKKKTPYLKEMAVSTKDEQVIKSSLTMDKVTSGLNLVVEIDAENPSVYTYKINQSHVSSIRLIGNEDNYIEGPSIIEHKTFGSSSFSDKIDDKYGSVERSDLSIFFSGDEIDESDRPFRFQMVSCPLTAAKNGTIQIN